MCDPAAFILLLAIAYNPLHLPQGMQLWGPLAKNSLREGTIQLLSDSSLFSITQRLTKPCTTTTIFVSCSRKHTHFKFQGLLPLPSSPLLRTGMGSSNEVDGNINIIASTSAWIQRNYNYNYNYYNNEATSKKINVGFDEVSNDSLT